MATRVSGAHDRLELEPHLATELATKNGTDAMVASSLDADVARETAWYPRRPSRVVADAANL
jgi:hypothetical protein